MRTLSLTYTEEHRAEHSGQLDILLLTISHPTIDEPIRLASGWTERFSETPLRYGVTSRSEEYDFLPFAWRLVEEGEEAPSELPLEVANFSPELIALLESVTTPATVVAEVVADDDPDTVEMSLPQMALKRHQYDDGRVSLSLAVDGRLGEPVPAHSFTPSFFGGLF